jgi:hypothetical protein
VSSSVLEIVELENGEIVLQYAGGEGEPLVNIRFSEEAKSYVENSAVDIAKIMIQAGIQAAAHLDVAENSEEHDAPINAEDDTSVNHTIH